MRQTRPFTLRWALWRRGAAIGIVCAVLDAFGGGHGASLHAQTTNITSSGLNTGISNNSSGAITFIDGGTRPGSGPNLFHSFGDFSVGTGHTALFRNSDGGVTNNIFGRVTGGSISNIFGTIDSGTNFPQANLWLINPNGFLFGPTATLNVGGSVNISSADYLKMADGNQFFADVSKNSVLSMEPVAAFGFTAPRPITIQESALSISSGRALSIVGGDLKITGGPNGFLDASSGQIALASVASPGEVAIGTTNTGTLDLRVDSFSKLGHIHLLEQAFLSVSGDSGGTVLIRGGGLTVDNSAIASITEGTLNGVVTAVDINVVGQTDITNGSSIGSIAGSGGRSGDLIIKSHTLSIDGSTIATIAESRGRGGDIDINTSGTLNVRAGGKINSVTTGNGDTGNILLTSKNLTGDQAQIGTSAGTASKGNAGTITADIGTLSFSGGSSISTATASTGNSGNITMKVGTLSLNGSSISTGTGSTGNAGNITADVGTLSSSGSSFISTSTTATGNAGNITANIETLSFSSGSAISNNTRSTGNSGSITVKVGTLSLIGGSKIASATDNDGDAGPVRITATNSVIVQGTNPGITEPSGISSFNTSSGVGSVGDVDITARTVTVKDGAQIASGTFGRGSAGTLKVNASESIELSGDTIDGRFPSSLSASSVSSEPGAGSAGNVIVDTGRLVIRDGAEVSSSTFGPGRGGGVKIRADEIIMSRLNVKGTLTSGISSQSIGRLADAGDAGEVILDTQHLTISDGAQISSTTFGGGAGGRLVINVRDTLLISGTGTIANASGLEAIAPSGVDSSSVGANLGSGSGGEIQITTNKLVVSGGGGISSSTTGPGLGGSITLNIGDSARFSGAAPMGLPSGLYSDTVGIATAGSITVSGTSLRPITISGGTIEAQSFGTAIGGNIKLQALRDLSLSGTSVLANNLGSGNAGAIDMLSGNNLFIKDSSVNTESAQASGGGIKLTAPNAIFIADSTLTSSVKGQVGSNGGNIFIDPIAVAIQNSQFSATANAGAGGNINVVASGAVLVDPNTRFDASAGPAGVSGSVNINAPIQVLGGTLVPLKVSYSQPALSGDRCAADPQGRFSSFVQTGRDGVPQIPGGYAPSPLLSLNRLTPSSTGTQRPTLTAARLGLTSMDILGSTRYQFQSGCRS